MNPAVVVALGMLVGCATTAPVAIEPFLDNAKDDGHGKRLHALEDHKLHVDEPSDLVVARDQLFTVSDAHSKLYAISHSGDVEDVIDVTGHDLEAIAYDVRTDEFLIADESSAGVWRVDREGTRQVLIDIDDAADANSGIEGLAFDADGHLYVAKEKDPARIYELDRDGIEVRRARIGFASDLSALAWDPDSRLLYALSDEDHALFRLDADLDAIAAWRLPIDQPEGLAFENGILYVVSDSEERIYGFAFDR